MPVSDGRDIFNSLDMADLAFRKEAVKTC